MVSILGITVATSIPPKLVRYQNGTDIGQEYQRLCIQSWIDAGFRVISLNFPDEIPQLKHQYPAVGFVEAYRDNSAILGRKTPLLSDLLKTLSEQKEHVVGIINSDIFLENQDWAAAITGAVHNAIAVAH